jgi:hypothetical protein
MITAPGDDRVIAELGERKVVDRDIRCSRE